MKMKLNLIPLALLFAIIAIGPCYGKTQKDTLHPYSPFAFTWQPSFSFSQQGIFLLYTPFNIEYRLGDPVTSIDLTTSFVKQYKGSSSISFINEINETIFQYDFGFRIYSKWRTNNKGFYFRPSVGFFTIYAKEKVINYFENLGINRTSFAIKGFGGAHIGIKTIRNNFVFNVSGGAYVSINNEFSNTKIEVGPNLKIGLGYQKQRK
jgi:hypothetical protein